MNTASTRKTTPSRCMFTLLLFGVLALPLTAMAVDCSQPEIWLKTQAEVDGFQDSYGGGGTCDVVTGFLMVEGADIVNVDGLSALTQAQLIIQNNANLTNLDGLSSLTASPVGVHIRNNAALTNVDGLSALTRAQLVIYDNDSLTNLDGLSAFTGSSLSIVENDALTNLDGLSALTESPNLYITIGQNDALTNLDGLSSLSYLGGLSIYGNDSLTNLDGLSNLASINYRLRLDGNGALTNLDGLSNLIYVGRDVSVQSNPVLANCAGLTQLLDGVDDGDPGPRIGAFRNPDVGGTVTMDGNLPGCNSVQEILGDSYAFLINAGLNDAWYNAATNGQGFLIIVFPVIEQVFVAWFTFDTERPAGNVTATLGDPGHRWLTAQGPFSGNTADLTLFVSKGGVFNAATPPVSLDPEGDGTLTIEFADCTEALVTYDIASLGISGEIPIQRIALDNVPLCEVLNDE